MKIHNPSSLAAPAGYSHGIETPGGARWLHTAGQLGGAADGSFPGEFRRQAEQAWHNLEAVLAAAGMGFEDVVKITTFLTRREDLAAYREVRTKVLGSRRPASTLLIISGLAREDALIEIEAVAAKA